VLVRNVGTWRARWREWNNNNCGIYASFNPEREIVKKRFHLLKFFIFSTSNVRVEGAR